jgi:ATP synthase protein I
LSERSDIIITNKAVAHRYLAIESAVTAVIALILLISMGKTAAYSALLGGAVFIMPNWLFTGVVFRRSDEDTARRILHRFFVGEALKIFVTIALFALSFMFVRPLNVIALFATFILVMIINVIGLAAFKTSN